MWNGTMFVDFDWPLNASSPLSASAELLVLPAGLPRSGKLPVLYLLTGKIPKARFFAPQGATRCTDSGQTLQSCAKFYLNRHRGVGMRPPKYQNFHFLVNVVFDFCCWSRSEPGAPCVRGSHSSNKHCVAVYCPISTRFSAFFEGIALLDELHSSHFVAR